MITIAGKMTIAPQAKERNRFDSDMMPGVSSPSGFRFSIITVILLLVIKAATARSGKRMLAINTDASTKNILSARNIYGLLNHGISKNSNPAYKAAPMLEVIRNQKRFSYGFVDISSDRPYVKSAFRSDQNR